MATWGTLNVGGWDGLAVERACLLAGLARDGQRFLAWKAENDAKHQARLDALCVAAFGMDCAAFDAFWGTD